MNVLPSIVKYVMPAILVIAVVVPSDAGDGDIAESPSAALHNVFAEFEAWERSELHSTPDDIVVTMQERRDELQWFATRARQIAATDLSTVDATNRAVFLYMTNERSGWIEHGGAFLCIGLDHGIHKSPAAMAGYVLHKPEECEWYLNELERLSMHIGYTIALLQAGVEKGLTQPRRVVEAVIAEMDVLIERGLSEVAGPLQQARAGMAEDVWLPYWQRLHAEVLPELDRAYKRLRQYIADDYLPQSAGSSGLGSLPGGRALYSHLLQTHTSLRLTPEECHLLGKREADRLRDLMIEAIRRTPIAIAYDECDRLTDDELFEWFRQQVQEGGDFYFQNADEFLSASRAVATNTEAQLPLLFHRLPQVELQIRQAPADYIPYSLAEYVSAEWTGGASAMVLLNPSGFQVLPRFMLTPLILHEAAPGHFLQMSLAEEHVERPALLRDCWVPAYVEGWAMYAERLGATMGMYDAAYDELGMLQWQLMRACRLVVDTGIHAHGWSLAQAEQYLRQHLLLRDAIIEQELRRALTVPGQGSAYTVGLEVLLRLRDEASSRLGEAFDLRDFHEVVLSDGAVPLDVLENRVMKWVADRTERSQPSAP